MAKSNYLSNKLLDHELGGPDYTRPATVYVALFTVTPTGSGGGTEVTGGSYARKSVTNNVTNFPTAASQTKSNGTIIDFGTASAGWGTVVAAAIFDASSGGNLLRYGALTTSRTVNTGDPFDIPVGGWVATEG